MRRFIKTTLGKFLSNVVAISLIIPYVAVLSASKANAQQLELPQWAVLDIVDKTGTAPAGIGAIAADAIRNELGVTGKYETIPAEQITRAYGSLNLVPPVNQPISLLRLGAELRATTIVTGDLVMYRFVKDPNGRHAEVQMTVRVLDVASGIHVNGAAVRANSTVRPADTADDTLLADALHSAAAAAILSITSKELPFGTILNTSQTYAYINRGTRSGFKPGQPLIVLRGREQVATAVVSEVEPDTSKIKILTFPKGVQPGDKCRVVFSEPQLNKIWANNGEVSTRKVKKPGANSGLYTLVAVLGLVAVALLTASGDQNAAATVRAEAVTISSGLPAVEINWSPDLFSKGTDRRVQWQIWRNDVIGSPALVTEGSVIKAVDDSVARIPGFANNFLTLTPGGITCDVPYASLAYNTTLSAAGVTNGIPYTYQVSLIYRLLGIELPTPDETNDWCAFTSSKTTAKGIATPYASPDLQTPTINEEVTGPVTFTFGAAGNPLAPNVLIEYIVQVSDTATFAKKVMVTKFQRIDSSGILTVGPIDLSGFYPSSQQLYWRVGVKNVADVPGPKPDVYTKERYIFSTPRRLVRL